VPFEQGSGRLDFDAAGLHRLGNFTFQFNVQQAVIQRGSGDLDVIGQVEAALERTGGYSPVEEAVVFIAVFFGLLAGHDQLVVLRRDIQIRFSEASDCHGNPIAVITGFLDIVGRETAPLFQAVG